MLRNASLGDVHDAMSEESRERLKMPPQERLQLDNPDLRLSVDVFMATLRASQDTYTAVRQCIKQRYPDSDMLSYDQVKRRISELSGVSAITHDMCPASCIAYTGPWANLEKCPVCGMERYSDQSKLVAHQQFHTLPIGPQLQALYRTPEGAEGMRHRQRRTEEILAELEQNNGLLDQYDDVYCGSDYLTEVQNGKICSDDITLILSLDGAQLYKNKASDTWVFIWIILDHAPDVRYKKKYVLPGGFVPGPNAPKNLDSFLFPALHHLAALQNDGLAIWDAQRDEKFISNPFLFLGCADVVGMAPISGLVGHHGKKGCRIYCTMPGRHKRGKPHYYPASLQPNDGPASHPDIPMDSLTGGSEDRYGHNLQYLKNAANKTQYEARRKETGICKPSIFSGLPRALPVPRCFSLDIMHHPALNMPDLLLGLWRATIDCDKDDDKSTWDWAANLRTPSIWKEHGKAVAAATPYLPGSFDRPPRNPAEKLNSGYKAWEFLVYLYGLGPGLFLGLLPLHYYQHFCKFVKVVRMLSQKRITTAQLCSAHKVVNEWSVEFEQLYYQRKHSRLHFVRPCIHTARHLAQEAARVGPGICSSQWTIERTIGNLGEEVRQPSNPFANLAQRGLYRSQTNALRAMLPHLDPDKALPRGSIDLGNAYVLLRAMDTTSRPVGQEVAEAINRYQENAGMEVYDGVPCVSHCDGMGHDYAMTSSPSTFHLALLHLVFPAQRPWLASYPPPNSLNSVLNDPISVQDMSRASHAPDSLHVCCSSVDSLHPLSIFTEGQKCETDIFCIQQQLSNEQKCFSGVSADLPCDSSLTLSFLRVFPCQRAFG